MSDYDITISHLCGDQYQVTGKGIHVVAEVHVGVTSVEYSSTYGYGISVYAPYVSISTWHRGPTTNTDHLGVTVNGKDYGEGRFDYRPFRVGNDGSRNVPVVVVNDRRDDAAAEVECKGVDYWMSSSVKTLSDSASRKMDAVVEALADMLMTDDAQREAVRSHLAQRVTVAGDALATAQANYNSAAATLSAFIEGN